VFGYQCVCLSTNKRPCLSESEILTSYLSLPSRSGIDRLITAKDHASIQIQIADVGADGKALKTSTTIALCGQVRSMGEADDSINRIATQKGGESMQRVFGCRLSEGFADGGTEIGMYRISPPKRLVVRQVDELVFEGEMKGTV
jgi:hypothetical protein